MDKLVENLKLAFEKPALDPEYIQGLLAGYIRDGHTDYERYCFWNKHKYARNLVEMNKNFELIVLCWENLQESPIHNHSGQHCWMAVLQGPMKETYFHATQAEHDRVTLTEGDAHIYETGQCAYIADEIALHKVSPAGDRRGATLHLYSKPIPGCNLYDPMTGTITKRVMGFFSKHGQKLVGSESSCQIYRELAQFLCNDALDQSYQRLLQAACHNGDVASTAAVGSS